MVFICRKYLVLLVAFLLIVSPLPSVKCEHSKNESKSESKSDSKSESKSDSKVTGCSFPKPKKEKTKECRKGDDRRKGKHPLCVGVRGNGARLWAHFPALARVVEAFGPAAAFAGGSSATITGFLFESVESNPRVLTCGEKCCCSDMEQRARISFLLKSFQAIPEASNIGITSALTPIVGEIVKQGIPQRLESGDKAEQEAAVVDLITILETEEAAKIINPEVKELLSKSPDPVYHANDILSASSGDFAIKGDPLVFIRPYLPSFPQIMELVDIVASFYSGLDPIDTDALDTLLDECAALSVGLEWKDIETVQIASTGSTCGEMLGSLYQDFVDKRNSTHPSRLDDPLGETVTTLITTSVLHGEGFKLWEEASEAYFRAERDVEFSPDYTDLSFGYWGDKKTLKMVSKRLPRLFDDAKSRKFLPLGPAIWRDVLIRSPAEPTLSRGVPIDDSSVSLGGWTDQVPAQVLTAMRCSRIVLINRPNGIGAFAFDVATLLGASEEELDSLYDLGDENSSWTTALLASDASICADWDTPPDQFDVEALSATGYEGPLLSDNSCILSLDVGATDDNPIKGCTPLFLG